MNTQVNWSRSRWDKNGHLRGISLGHRKGRGEAIIPFLGLTFGLTVYFVAQDPVIARWIAWLF